MKKLIRNIAITCVLALVFAIAACEPAAVKEQKSVTLTVVTAEYAEDFTVTGLIATLYDAMDILAQTNEDFSFEEVDTQWGKSIAKVCGYAPEGEYGFWGLYTDMIYDVGKGAKNATDGDYNAEYNGKPYYFCNNYASSQPAADGEHFLLFLN